LILTVDCGTAAHDAITGANAAGAEVIVIDHHQADETLPPAYAVINPNRQDDLSGQGHLAAAGVVFLFLVATTRLLRRNGFYGDKPEPDLLGLLDLVALATVCDVVPLKEANRAFVAQGLRVLRLRHNQGLRALADAARIDAAPTCFTLGFVLGPRINAGGRVGASSLGARLLACDDEIEARSLAAKLEASNSERKAIEERMLEEAFALADASLEREPESPLVFLGAEGWHKGLLGLIAGRVAERYRRPAFVTAFEPDGTATGSARSIASVDLGSVVRAAVHEGLLLKGGGHAMAAGFKLERGWQEALVQFLVLHLAEPVRQAVSVRHFAMDGVLSAHAASLELIDLLERAGPYGPGHPEPRFVFPAHRLSRVRSLKETHLRCTLHAPDGGRIEACAFRVADTPLGRTLLKSEGLPLHVAGHLRRTSWQGRDSVELMIVDAAEMH
jgi:single-stranded-DNA-specific exonuclease